MIGQSGKDSLFKEIALAALALLCVLGLVCPQPVLALSPPVGTLLSNTVTADYVSANGYVYPRLSSSVTTEISGAPVLHLNVNATPDPVPAGGTLTYTLTLENTGNSAATMVNLTAPLPGSLQFVSASHGGLLTPAAILWELGTLAAGESVTVTLVTTVAPELSDGTSIPLTLKALSSEGATDSATITVGVGFAPNLQIIDSASVTTTTAGGTIIYTIAYRNIGSSMANGVVISNELPPGTALVSGTITDGGTVSGRTLTWRLGSLPPNSSGTASFTVSVSSLARVGELIRNRSTILSFETDPILSNEVIIPVISVVLPVLTLVKTALTALPRPGTPLDYTLTVRNSGSIDATGVTLRDPLPVGTTFVSADQGGVVQAGEVRWTLAPLAVGQSVTATLHLVVDRDFTEATLSNTAFASADGIGEVEGSVAQSLSPRTRGRINFIDAAGAQVNQYQIGDQICAEVSDADRNLDPALTEKINVLLAHEHRQSDGTVRVDDSVSFDLTETGIDRGIFRGCVASNNGPPQSDDTILSLESDSLVRATYTDPLDELPTSTDSAFIDPLGVVFNSVTGLPVANAVVTLIDKATGLPALLPQPPLVGVAQQNSVTTGADGAFQFRYVNPGTYYLQVYPQGTNTDFSFPTKLLNSDLPPGYVIDVGSRGEDFTLTTGMSPLNLDLPVDPPPGQLQVVKTANKEAASIGDMVIYTVNINNVGDTAVQDIDIVDTFPHGLIYRSGSTLIGGKRAADPESSGKRTLVWAVPALDPGTSLTLVYTVIIGPDSQRGDGRNTVQALGMSVGKSIASNTSVKTIKITEGVFTSEGIILGKVYIDDNQDQLQNKDGEREGQGEGGVSGVVLFMEDGRRVVTDAAGKFSIPGVRSGTHILRLDESTLPRGIQLPKEGDRFTPGGSSRIVDLAVSGLFKADFPLFKSEQRVQSETLPVGEEGPAPVIGAEGSRDLEKEILEMTPELSFLNLRDGEVIPASHLKFIVKTATEGDLTVFINNESLSTDRLGRRIKSSRVALYEFVNVPLLTGEENVLRAELRDPFGNLRESRTLTVVAAGPAANIKLTATATESPADGTSTVRLQALLQDRKGTTVIYPKMVTVETSLGEILDKDIDGATPGIQIPCHQGVAGITVKAPFVPGTATISVRYDEIIADKDIFFAPHLRSFMVVGLGEATLGYGSKKSQERDGAFDNNLHLWGRGAFFVKGEVGGGALLTAAYDSDKEKPDDYFHGGSLNTEAEDKYPLYGDESKFGHDAMSREKLYLRVDKDHSSLLFGDYDTNLSGTRFSSYQRTLTGLKGDVVFDNAKLSLFASETAQSQVVEAFPGKGIAGYYFLKQELVEGSERVVIETRDRLQGDRVLNRETLSRWSDYAIDYEMKSLLFKAPVPSHDANLNPLYIIVVYETRSGASYTVQGGRATVQPFPWLEVGATTINAEQETHDYHLLGGDITLKLPARTTITAEIAQSDSSFELNNLPTAKSGSGWGIEMTSTPAPGLSLSGYYRAVGNYFDNPSATDVMRGTRKYGLDGLYGSASTLLWRGKFSDEKDLLNVTHHQLSSLGAEKSYGRTKLALELIRETSSDRFISPATSSSREPFDIQEETAQEMTATKVSLETPLTTDLSLVLSHLQDIQFNRHNLSQAGLNYQITQKQRLYLREEYAHFDERSESRTVLGGESNLGQNTVVFDEYRLASSASGSSTQQSIGLRNNFTLSEKITGNLSVEKLMTLTGNDRSTEPDAFAASTGVEYLLRPTFKLTSRLEYRKESSTSAQDSWLGEFGAACKLHRDYTLLVSERYFFNDFKNQGTRVTTRTAAGIAYRPVNTNRFNALGKIELKHEENNIQPTTLVADAYIVGIEGVYQATRRLQLTGKYAGKRVVDNALGTYTDLVAGRVLYDLTRRFDIGGEYRLLTNHTTNTVRQGGSVEVGYRVIDQLWLALGYAFDRFDADLAGDNTMGQGPFIRLRLKIDEMSLMQLRRSRNNVGEAKAH